METPKALPLAGGALLAPYGLSADTACPSPASLNGEASRRRQLVLTEDTVSEAASLLALEECPSRDSLECNAADKIR